MKTQLKLVLFLAFFFILSNGIEVNSQDRISRKVIAQETFLPYITAKDSASSIKKLSRELDRIIANASLGNSQFSIAVYSIDRQRYIFEKNSSLKLTPASTTKLISTFTALANKGGNYKVRTQVLADTTIDAKGVLNGNVYLKGYGDALLSDSDIISLADSLIASGLKEIKGNICADGSYFDPEKSRFKYSKDLDEVQGMAPVSALSVNKNEVALNIFGGRNINVSLNPRSAGITASVHATINGSPSKGSNLIKSNDQNEMGYVLPQYYGDRNTDLAKKRAKNGLKISSYLLENGVQQFVIKGALGANKSEYHRFYIKNPELAAAGVLKTALRDKGVIISGILEEKAIANNKKPVKLAQFDRYIVEMLHPVLKNSDNYVAEHFFKMNSAFNDVFDNCLLGCQDLTYKTLSRYNIDPTDIIVNDGSGLSRRNKVSAIDLTQILNVAYKSDFRRQYDSALAIAGVDGTLLKRMKNSPAEGNVRAKTGTLRNVSALAGYVETIDGETLAFSFIFNGYGVGVYKNLEDELAKSLAQFFYYNEEY